MAKISKFFQISEKILLEYSYDTYNPSSRLSQAFAGVIEQLDGRKAVFETPSRDDMQERYRSSFLFSSYPNETGDAAFYTGYTQVSKLSSVNSACQDRLVSDRRISRIVLAPSPVQIYYDTVRVHVLTGYNFADVAGFLMTFAAHAVQGPDVVLRNFTFNKGAGLVSAGTGCVTFNPRPVYLSGKFYDRYIEFTVPSAYWLASAANPGSGTIQGVLNVKHGSGVSVAFTEITDDNWRLIENPVAYTSGATLIGQADLMLTNQVDAEIPYNSQSDWFNIRLGVDEDRRAVEFYSVWGDVIDDQPMTMTVMNQIETGDIRILTDSFMDDSDVDWEEFTEIYGPEARKWVIRNELTLTYRYNSYTFAGSELYEYQNIHQKERIDRYTMLEDFNDSTLADSDADSTYKFFYRPVIPELPGYDCVAMDIEYTARLLNRLNGAEVVRMATLTVEQPLRAFEDKSAEISVNNMNQWVLFNKNVINQIVPDSSALAAQRDSRIRYISNFYTNNDIVIQAGTDTFTTMGTNTLVLYDTDHYYKFSVWSDLTLSQPWALDQATAEYMLTYTDKDDIRKYIAPTYSVNMSLAAGTIEFKLTESMVKSILGGNGRYAVIARTPEGTTTVFAGRAVSIYSTESDNS